MALTTCRECGEEVSSKADQCPNCGISDPGKSGVSRLFSGGGGGLLGGSGNSGCGCSSLVYLLAGILLFSMLSDDCGGGSTTDSGPSTTDYSSEDIRYVHTATNVRAGRTTDSSVVETLHPGDSVEVGTRQNEWYAVYDPGSASSSPLGYVYAPLLEDDPPAPGEGSGGGGSETGGDQRITATVMCEQFVEDRLVAPSTAEFPWSLSTEGTYLGDGRYRFNSYVDAENQFGANIRRDFTCTVEYRGNEEWRLINLEFY